MSQTQNDLIFYIPVVGRKGGKEVLEKHSSYSRLEWLLFRGSLMGQVCNGLLELRHKGICSLCTPIKNVGVRNEQRGGGGIRCASTLWRVCWGGSAPKVHCYPPWDFAGKACLAQFAEVRIAAHLPNAQPGGGRVGGEL